MLRSEVRLLESCQSFLEMKDAGGKVQKRLKTLRMDIELWSRFSASAVRGVTLTRLLLPGACANPSFLLVICDGSPPDLNLKGRGSRRSSEAHSEPFWSIAELCRALFSGSEGRGGGGRAGVLK